MELVDYKKKLGDFISELNNLIQNPLYFPNYLGGGYKLVTSENGDTFTISLVFEELGDTLVLHNHSTNLSDKQEAYFYQIFYEKVFRHMMLGVDVGFGDIVDPFSGEYLFYLSFKTLSCDGLKQYREWKESAKKCFSCGKLNKPKNKKCVFCKEELETE